MNQITVGVIGGLGHIGLIQAASMAKLGYQTTAYDINLKAMEGIKKGQMPFKEAGLKDLVMDTLSQGLLTFTSQIKDLEKAEIIFICVGTPSLPTGEADLSQVYTAVEIIAENRTKPCLAVLKSTVPVGTSNKLTEHLKKLGHSDKVTMVFSPEFLAEGSGVKDFWEPARIVVGSPLQEICEKVANLYAPPGAAIVLTSWENAELIKLASNAFLSTKISYINEIASFCEAAGADVRVISQGIGLDPRINPYFLKAGVGFSGPCLEKDIKSLISQFKKANKKPRILEAVLETNEVQRELVIEKLREELGTLKDKEIAVFGMAFKEETDDVRQSHNLPIVKHLLSQGVKVTVNDPWVKTPEQGGLSEDELPGVIWSACPYEAATDKDAILILTAWQDYTELDPAKLKDKMKNPFIVDGRNLFNVKEMKAYDIKYVGVGI